MWLQVDMEADLDMLASLALMQARQAARPPATHQLKATVHTGSAGAFVPPLVAECTEQYTCSNTCSDERRHSTRWCITLAGKMSRSTAHGIARGR